MILSQLAMTQGSTGGTEFDELEKTLRQQYPTQSQTQTGQNKKKKANQRQNPPRLHYLKEDRPVPEVIQKKKE